jgi:hypothetical protein
MSLVVGAEEADDVALVGRIYPEVPGDATLIRTLATPL